MHDTEDKEFWCKHGEKIEDYFLENIVPLLPYNIIKNPEKANNKFAPDFSLDGHLCDLKSQNTPFFKAGDFYDIDPRYAVTFNHKDYNRYMKKYPNIGIFFYVNWMDLEKDINGTLYTVEPLIGVWMTGIKKIHSMVDGLSSHNYGRRVSDNRGNAKASYCLNLKDMKCIWRKNDKSNSTSKQASWFNIPTESN